MVNEFGSAACGAQDIIPPNSLLNTADALGIPNININNHAGGLPALAVTGFVSFDTGGRIRNSAEPCPCNMRTS